MSELGDIGAILEENNSRTANEDSILDAAVADLRWLEVDMDEYRATEALPHQNLDAIPELVAQWRDLSDAQAFALSPDNREPDSPTSPFWSEVEQPKALDRGATEELIRHFAMMQVQAGRTGRDFVAIMRSKFDRETITEHSGVIRDVLAERGLLGPVYIESKLFSDCDQGNPQGLTANTKTAKFVKAKEKCADCVFAQDGRCSVFKKELVFDVNYNESLWDRYQSELLGRDLSGLDDVPVKARLQTAFLKAPLQHHTELDSKPVVPDLSAKVSFKDAQEQLHAAVNEREVVAVRTQRERELGLQMMRGNHGEKVRQEIRAGKFVRLAKGLDLLGSLYIDLSYFPTFKEAREFVANHGGNPLLIGVPYDSGKAATAQALDFKAPKVLARIAGQILLTKMGKKATGRKDLFKKLYAGLSKKDEKDIRRIARQAFTAPVPQDVKAYEAQFIYDPTHGVSIREAEEQLRNVSVTREKAEDPMSVKGRQVLVESMLRGNHGSKVETLLKQASMSVLSDHFMLLGNLYVDTALVSPEQIRKASRVNPQLESLPVLTNNNRDLFFTKPEVHAQIAKRIAAVKGIKDEPQHTNFLRSTIGKLSNLDEDKVKTLARQAFKTPVKEFRSSAGAPVGSNEDFEFGKIARELPVEFELNESPQESLEDVEVGGGLILE